MLEAVINVSEGQDPVLLGTLAEACGDSLLDLHTDSHHNRSVLTLAGHDVEAAARTLATETVSMLDISEHTGVHPRIGVVDVVPFVPIPGTTSTIADAIDARDRFAGWMGAELAVPCFLYGPERTLPDVRKKAFVDIAPDFGPSVPHPSAGACATGARPVLIAYNVWLQSPDVGLARSIARLIRRPGLRTLGLDVGGNAQVSCNIVDTDLVTPADVIDLVTVHAPVLRTELVGLLPSEVLKRIPRNRWDELDLGSDRTIEARIAPTGLNRGKLPSNEP